MPGKCTSNLQKRGFGLGRLCCVALLVSASVASSQETASAPQMPSPAVFAKLRAERARADAMPDTPGTGRYPAMKEEIATLPDHVIYRPRNLAAVGPAALGVVVWGNGGCEADGAGQRLHLAQIASHGYLVIANGRILSGPGVPFKPQPPKSVPGAPMTLPPPATSVAQLTQAIDWAVGENTRADSPYQGKIDTRAVAVSGWSCGGLQAIELAASDPRIKTAIIHDSGIFAAHNPIPGMTITKAALDRLHAPILYVLGGPSDIAYVNGMDDFARITKVPVMVANQGDVGHGGSFYQPDGGRAALMAVAWLDWQLKKDAAAARAFAGPDCTYCRDAAWKIQKKGF